MLLLQYFAKFRFAADVTGKSGMYDNPLEAGGSSRGLGVAADVDCSVEEEEEKNEEEGSLVKDVGGVVD